MWRVFRSIGLAVALLALASCGDPTKEDIIDKARGIDNRDALQEALGKPDDITKVGPIETWVYKATNGSVAFLITGDTVQLQAAAGKSD